jgi:transcriptional antiterminator NusG
MIEQEERNFEQTNDISKEVSSSDNLEELNLDSTSSGVSEAAEEITDTEDTEDQEASKEVEDDDRAWYVVHCYSGYENKVRHNLEQRIETMGMKDKIFDVVVPTEEEIEVKEGKRRTVERRVFPGCGAQYSRRHRFRRDGQPAYSPSSGRGRPDYQTHGS